MADEIVDGAGPGASEAATPAPTGSPEPSPSTPDAPESSPPSFGDNLRATAGQTPSAGFTQADIDARLATEKDTWEKANAEKWKWAEGLTPEEWATYRDAIQGARVDPVGNATQLLAAALNSPQHRPAAMALARQLLAGYETTSGVGATRTQPAADVEPQADVEGQRPDGTIVRLYSAEQQAKRDAWFMRQVEGKLKPFEEDRQNTAKAREHAERQQAEVNFAVDVYQRMTQRPGFTDHQQAIYEAWAKMPGNDDPYTARENLHDAYTSVVYNKLQSAVSTSAVADQQRRGAANTGRVVTSTPTQASAPVKASFSELLAQEMAQQRKRGA